MSVAITAMSRAEVWRLIYHNLKQLGLTLKEFKALDCCDRQRTLPGLHASMFLTVLRLSANKAQQLLVERGHPVGARESNDL